MNEPKSSTITYFVDKLHKRGLVERTQKGRNVYVHPTQAGKEFKAIVEQALRILHDAYSDKLGIEMTKNITSNIQQINSIFQKQT